MNGLETLTGRIMGDAKSFADDVKAQSEIKINKILLDYHNEADALTQDIVSAAEQEAAMIRSRAENQQALSERNELLRAKRELIDEVFANACSLLCALPREQYVDLLASLVAKYQTGTAQIILNERDQKEIGSDLLGRIVVNKIKKIDISLIKISKTTGHFEGGFILRQGEIDTNCTAEVLCDGLRHELEPKIIEILGF